MSKHAAKVDHGEFCARRKNPCCDGNRHDVVTDADELEHPWGAGEAPSYQFRETAKVPKAGKKDHPPGKLEAHHLLCVSSVNEHICGGGTEDCPILDIIRVTKWCINSKHNMMALPNFGNTIKYYCDLNTKGLSVLDRVGTSGGLLATAVTLRPPPFVNLPQHDYQHTGNKSYKGALNSLSQKFRNMLKSLGSLNGGTHVCWVKATNGDTDGWYRPFCMTFHAPAREFPLPGGKNSGDLWKKIKSLANAVMVYGPA